ncbi:DEAD/DEAH box helicase domain protein [Pseudovibrio sp. FO-BEG1]|uniref:ATP-dependent RNA helicase DeaD n=1 Tax=Pseudovibrio denitrificans TaxID=258256 RepID=A0A1I7DX67_9HYPH|nr:MULTISPECIES: DEAD/DEAH box helicase [Pseudovibrio]AEV39520.1 DEAD/DEAH box helicase domain protein [Pseudovibrio sp. FO-BEG1]EEA92227.1 dead-box ATP-dependent rna helicase 53 [Pseudovibrio sp. JE062]SFU16277.1 ATP-dependent RNA helicase DeaD [Pseudovibrio denitrificans]
MTIPEGVSPALSTALEKREYTSLTPVQTAVLDEELKGKDLLVSAQTGSGKTVAFGIAIAPELLGDEERMGRANEPLALCVAPTRELAIQVSKELEWLYGEAGARITTCVGGMDMRRERRNLSAGAHIVVGTPGRLRDHIERGSFDTSALRTVVLDEADEMLDLGFREDLEFILDAAPEERRTLLFSATVPPQIESLAKRFQRDAQRISTVTNREQHADIEYRAMQVAPNDRENAIINVLRFYEAQNTIIFCGTREMVKHLSARLGNRGFAVVALSGELSQAERNHALGAMRNGRARVCVATDVAARGIDLPNLDLVIHADLPNNAETLLHRSGRTGRAGRKGVCTLVVPHTRRRSATRLLGFAKVKAEWGPAPTAQQIRDKDRERILASTDLQEAPSEEDLPMVQELLEKFTPEQIAAAYMRQIHQGLPAPEELLASSFEDRERKPRKDFDNGVWFRLNVGRKHNAEPRWLLPMICRAGHITKKDIGSIRIFDADSRFELDAKLADKFQETVKENGTGEKSITITRIEGNPERGSSGRPGGRRNHRGGGGGGYRGEGGRGEGRGRGRGGEGGGYRGRRDRDGEGRGRGRGENKPGGGKSFRDNRGGE